MAESPTTNNTQTPRERKTFLFFHVHGDSVLFVKDDVEADVMKSDQLTFSILAPPVLTLADLKML